MRKPILEYTEEEFDRVVAVNLKGSLNVLQAAIVADGGWTAIDGRFTPPGH